MDATEIRSCFRTEAICIQHLENLRWNHIPSCPYCQSKNSTPIPGESRYHCNICNTSYSVTVGTVFHHTHIPLQKWFLAIHDFLMTNGAISSRELAKNIYVNRNTAWRMIGKIRGAFMQREQRELLLNLFE